jgi:hypothetical protein
MWNRSAFEALSQKLSLNIDVDWGRLPSPSKYGGVNSVLALLLFLSENSGEFLHPNGEACSTLTIEPMHRKLCDQGKRNFTIVGHPTGRPLLLVAVGKLLFEIYFNYHLFVETETTYCQYFPSASVILRCQNFLWSTYTRSPGSWGSDIIQMNFDWDGTFILESSVSGVPTRLRKNFRGFKFIPSVYKYFITQQKLAQSETQFLRNNGFQGVVISGSTEAGTNEIRKFAQIFLVAQARRLNSEVGNVS